MAKIVGQSGALATVQARLATHGLTIHAPSGLPGLVRALEDALPQARIHAEALFASRLAELGGALRELTEKARVERESRCAWLDAEITGVSAGLNALAADSRSLFWPPKLIRELALRIKLARLRRERDAGPTQTNAPLRAGARAVETHRRSHEAFVRGAIQAAQTRLDAAKSALESPEFKGAVAECEVADALAKLPDGYTVLHSMKLSIPRAVSFKGNWLRTAQLDHTVVGPSGVFVIETKAWSRGFVESADHFSPFLQVERAGYMAFRTLRESGLECKVRSIIATRHSLPNKPDGSFVTVLPPDELCGFIQYFPPTLTPARAETIVRLLKPCVR